MKKVSLFLGALGGALAGYLLSNDKLREEMMKAKKPEDAAKALGKHLSKDGQKLGVEVKKFVESEDVQKNLKKAKAFATAKMGDAKQGLEKMMKKGTKEAKKMMGGEKKSGKKGA